MAKNSLPCGSTTSKLAFLPKHREHDAVYEWRQLCEREQLDLARRRMRLGRPIHAPPHSRGGGVFMITGTCFEHACFVQPDARLAEFASEWMQVLTAPAGGKVVAWVVLPNHYHALWQGNLDLLGAQLGRLHNGTSTRWNREDAQPGRKVWHRFTDRRIRSEGHYYAAINYIHANPAKHGWASRADCWQNSSIHDWLRSRGRDYLADLWKKYPPNRMGKAWDDL